MIPFFSHTDLKTTPLRPTNPTFYSPISDSDHVPLGICHCRVLTLTDCSVIAKIEINKPYWVQPILNCFLSQVIWGRGDVAALKYWVRAAETLNFILSLMRKSVLNVDRSRLTDSNLLNRAGVIGWVSVHLLSQPFITRLMVHLCVRGRASEKHWMEAAGILNSVTTT